MKTIDKMKIRDARGPLIVRIEMNDVKTGGVQQPSKCAAAKALCRNPSIAEARVHISRTYVRKKGEDYWLRYATPMSLRTEIIAFDRGGKFQPGDFVLAKPAQTPGWQQGSKRNQNRRGPKEPRKYIVADVRPDARKEFD